MNTFKKKVLLLGMLTNLTTLSLTGCADQSIYCPYMNTTIKYEKRIFVMSIFMII